MSSENVLPTDEHENDAVRTLSQSPQHHKQFYAHVLRQVQVRFHLKNMCTSVANMIINEVLGELIKPDAEAAYKVAQLRELSGALDQRFAKYVFSEELLRADNGGDVRPQRLDKLVNAEFEARGLQPARGRLVVLQSRFISAERQKKATRFIAEKIFADLQRLAPHSIATLQLLLDKSIAQVMKMLEQVSNGVSAINNQRTQLEEALREAKQRAAAGLTAADAESRSDSEEENERAGGLHRAWRAVLNFFVGAISGADATTNTESVERINEAPAADSTLIVQIERELLQLEVRLLMRQTEQEMLNNLSILLSYERDNNQVLLNLIHASQQSAPSAIEQAERTRDYDLAGGEFLLNGADLTAAALQAGFAASETARKRWHDNFRTICLKAINQAGGNHDHTLIERMYKDVEEAVVHRFEGFRVIDALVALRRHKPHFDARLRTAFEEITRTDFLAPGYERQLDLQRFSRVTYVPSEQEAVNAAFRSMLDTTLQAIHVAAKIMPVGVDDDILRFCVVDYVPLTALSSYQESLILYNKHKNDPRYNIHPELAA